MKKWNMKQLVVSTIIFLFTVMAVAPVAGQASTVPQTAQLMQERFAQAAAEAPYVQMHAPKIAKLDNLGDENVRGSRVFVRQVVDSDIVAKALMNVALPGKTAVKSTDKAYSPGSGAFVNLGGTNLMSGFLNVDRLDNSVASRIDAVMQNPEKYGLDKAAFNVQMHPRLIEVATVDIKNHMTKAHIVAVDTSIQSADKAGLKNTLNKLYTAFKGFVDIQHARTPTQPIMLNTGFPTGSDQRLVTVLQMLAANIAGVDQLTFHNAGDNAVIQDAQKFIQDHQGQSISNILDDLASGR